MQHIVHSSANKIISCNFEAHIKKIIIPFLMIGFGCIILSSRFKRELLSGKKISSAINNAYFASMNVFPLTCIQKTGCFKNFVGSSVFGGFTLHKAKKEH